jgi:IS1 family transposase
MNCGVLLKKQKNVEPCSSNRSEEGDAWIYTCIKRNTYLFVAFSVGKWTQESCGRMIEKLSERTEQPSLQTKIEVFTDGNDDYTYVLPDYYADTCINYGQLVKIRENGRVVRKEKRAIYGTPDPRDIETTDIENYNGILRERIGRLVRKTKCFSKRRWILKCSL